MNGDYDIQHTRETSFNGLQVKWFTRLHLNGNYLVANSIQ
jgi:hypothetical protein